MVESQVMVLTGCASGIGRHLAGALAARGHLLVLTDVNLPGVVELVRQRAMPDEQIEIRQLDVRNAADWEETLDAAIRRFGRIDVVMNIAGYLRPGLLHEQSADEIDRHIDINAKGTMFGTLAAASRMVRQGSGHIINIASMAALAPVSGIGLYTASKFAVRGFSLAVAYELRPLGVAVTVICPDAVQTPMLDLQLDYPEAALTFSGKRALAVEDLERLILGRVLARRPLEAILPGSRGWLAKITSAFPSASRYLLPRLTKKGLAGQAAARAKRTELGVTERVAPPSKSS